MCGKALSPSLNNVPSHKADWSSYDINMHDLPNSILHTVKYSDLFDYPLTEKEIHRYLIGVQASPEQVHAFLKNSQWTSRHLSHKDGYFALSGRESIIEIRRQRATISLHLWRKAVRYGRQIASLPYVRMVAVTGTLAVDNAEPGADIDYLIVTEPHRLWLVRSLVILLVHIARLESLVLCPNYLMTVEALEQFEHSLFTAHELAQMVPLYGTDVYRQLLNQNDWARCFFPNAFDDHRIRVLEHRAAALTGLKHMIESILAGRLGDWWEQHIQSTKIPQLTAQAHKRKSKSAAFTPQLCKGHMDDHSQKITRLYANHIKRTDYSPE